MSRNYKLTIGFAVIVAAMAFLMVGAMSGNTMYYLTVDEVLDQRPGLGNLFTRTIRVQGTLVADGVSYDIRTPLLKFQIQGDSGRKLSVEYRGAKPDNMERATSAIVEGRLQPGGVIVASRVLMQCPSKYEGNAKGEERR